MAALFGSIEGREGSIAAIHCNKGLCYRIAAAARSDWARRQLQALDGCYRGERYRLSPWLRRRSHLG